MVEMINQKEKKRLLSILIPAYNEEKTIASLLKKVQSVDLSGMNVEKEIVLVDDGSTDDTVKIAKAFPDIKVIVHDRNRGKGAAIRTGIQKSKGDIIIIQDADLEYDPDDYRNLLVPIIERGAKVVYGSRRLKKENKKHSSLAFFLGGVGLTWLANTLYPGLNITDEPTCYKVFDARLIRSIKLNCNGFEFCPEVTAKLAKKKIKIVEVPISYFPRSILDGKKIRWIDGLVAIWTLIKHRFTD